MNWIAWTIYPIAGALIGLLAWGSNPAIMPVALGIFPLWYSAPNRWIAWATMLCYLMAAAHGLPLASMQYFHADFLPAFFDLALAALIPSIPFLLFYFNKKILRAIGLLLATIIIMVPPFGLTCWTHPLASTGIWFPGSGWPGLALAIVLIPALCRWPLLLVVPLVLSFISNQSLLSPPPAWGTLNTHFSGEPGRRKNFDKPKLNIADLGQQAKTVSLVNKTDNSIRFLLLPESSGGNWSGGIDLLWQSMLTWPGTVLIGASEPAGQHKDSVILAVSRDKNTRIIYRQRQPVPVSMWYPGKSYSYLAHWFDNPVVQVDGSRVAFFVCYEQFMTWPVLHSTWHNPDIFAATSNVWWSADTNIPAIQHNIMLSWSQLFSVPLLTAKNF